MVVFNHPVSVLFLAFQKQLREEAEPPKPEPKSMRHELTDFDWALRKHAIEVEQPKLGALPLMELCQIKILEELGPIKSGDVFDSFPEHVDVSFGRSIAARMVKKRNYDLLDAGFQAAIEKVFPKPYVVNELREFNSITMEYIDGTTLPIRGGMYGLD